MKKRQFQVRLWFDRLLSKSIWRQFGLLAVALVFAFGLSYLLLSLSGAEWTAFCDKNDVSRCLLPLYLLIDSNVLNAMYLGGHVHGWMLFVSSVTFLTGAFIFNGAIIGIITNFIEQRVRSHREGHLHYLKSGHYIIMGYDDMVPSIIMHIFEKDKDAYVLMMSAASAEGIREKLRKVFDEDTLSHIIINYGHRMSKGYYKDIHLECAEQIFIVGMRSLPAHDAINVECVDSICEYFQECSVKELPKRITCVFEDLDTYAAFKTSEIFGRVRNLGIEFVPYNFYAGWAKQVFVKRFHKDMNHPGLKISYPSVYGDNGITSDDDKYVHLVFAGTTNFSVAFAMEAAHVLHFPNFKEKKGPRTRITFIDINADKEKDVFIARNRHFFEIQSYIYRDLSVGNGLADDKYGKEYLRFSAKESDFLDVEFEFIKGDIFSRKVQDEILKWAKEHNKTQYLSLFLALADQRQNFIFGMNMPDEVYDNGVNIFIRQDRSDNFVSNLRAADEKICNDDNKNTYYYVEKGKLRKREHLGGRYAHVYPFGMNETAYSADEKSLRRAKLINYLYSTANYDENKFQSIVLLDSIPEEQIWKEADDAWQRLSVALKWSNLYNAYAIRIKLTSLRALRGLDINDTSHDTTPLSDAEVEQLAKVEHNRWTVEKLLMGYRKPLSDEDKYAAGNEVFKADLIKNKERFIHYDIRPYDELDENEKELDRIFSEYIPWIIKKTDTIQR